MNFTDKDLKQLESVFVKEQPASFLEKVNEKLAEQGTWRGIMMIAIAFLPQLQAIGIDAEMIFNVFTGIASIYGVQNIITKG